VRGEIVEHQMDRSRGESGDRRQSLPRRISTAPGRDARPAATARAGPRQRLERTASLVREANNVFLLAPSDRR
jgi:hypothetical protein